MTKTSKYSQKRRNNVNLALVIALCVVSAMLLTTSILWLSNIRKMNELSVRLENTYQQNYYELVDNVNNAEVKMAKVLAGNDGDYCKKMLTEISKNASGASRNLGNLPISENSINETKKFINQVSGYTTYLTEKLDKGQNLTSAEKEILDNIHQGLSELKNDLGKFSQQILIGGYSIVSNEKILSGDYNQFTQKIMGTKSSSVEYPTMIYDGPFSDSELQKKVLGLNGDLVTLEQAKQTIKEIYKTLQDGDINYIGETSGKFSTFDFNIKLNNHSLYVQVTKLGGKLLTVSGGYGNNNSQISLDDAITKAKNVANLQTRQNMECVWSDTIGGFAYINLAPIESGTIIYPDLVKAKIDLSSGDLVGYSATSYYTNHTKRQIESASISKEAAMLSVSNDFGLKSTKLCIAPLEFGDEKLCWEIKAMKDQSIYYFYINAKNGKTENILKVIETTDGNKLM